MLRAILWNLRCRSLGPSRALLKSLQRACAHAPDETRRLQRQRLEHLLAHAHATVPRYKRILEECGVITDRGHVDLAHFGRIPPLERSDVQNRAPDLISASADMRTSCWESSGGSTGAPAQVLLDSHARAWLLAVQDLFDSWTGYKPGQRRLYLWGSERELFYGKEPLRASIGRWLRNESVLNAFRMDKQRMRTYLQTISETRPALLIAYADCIFELARVAEREGIGVRSPGAIISSAGTLYPTMRSAIERVFQTRVFNRYGCREVGNIACEDRSHTGLIVCAPTHYVEIVRSDGSYCEPGETGEVLVTLLVNYAMPILRYRLGDLAAWAPGPTTASRPWPVLESVAGRTLDALVRADGGIVSPTVFAHTVGVVMNDGWIRKYQVVQEDVDSILVSIVPIDSTMSAAEMVERSRDLPLKMRDAVGATCRIRFQLVDAIAPSPSGKHRWVISKVPRSAPHTESLQ